MSSIEFIVKSVVTLKNLGPVFQPIDENQSQNRLRLVCVIALSKSGSFG